MERASSFGKVLGYGDDYQCSMGWISRWKKRHNIGFGKISGEAMSVNKEVTSDWLANTWPTVKSALNILQSMWIVIYSMQMKQGYFIN